MAEIKVTTSELRNKAEELSTQNTQLKGKVDELVASEGTLTSMWEGEARDAFHKAFETDKNQWENFMKVIEQFVQAMNQIADEYDKQEAANAQIAGNRTY